MGADKDVDFARFDGLIEMGKVGIFFIVAIKTSNFGVGKKTAEFGFKEFGAKTFVYDVGVVAIGARGRNFFFVAADMAGEEVAVGV